MSTASLYFVEAALELFRSPSIRPHHSSGGLQSTKGRPRSKEDQHLTTFQNKRNSNTNKKRISLKKLPDQPDMLNTSSLSLSPFMTRKKSKQESQKCCSLLQFLKTGKSLASIWKDKNSLKIRDYSMPN